MRRVHPRAFLFASVEADWQAMTWAAALQGGRGAVVSHEASLCRHGVGHVPFRPALIVAPDRHHDVPGVRVHRFADVLAEHVVDLGGLPATTVARAVVDVTSVFSRARLGDLLDRVTIIERRAPLGSIARVYRQVNRRGRRDIRVLGELLDDRSEQAPCPRSGLERRADEIIARSGLPMPLHEMPLPSLDARPALVDRAWPEVKVILELDGRRWHARERAMATDRARDRAAGAQGWYTARVLDEEVRDQPELVAADILALYRRRRIQLGHAGVAA